MLLLTSRSRHFIRPTWVFFLLLLILAWPAPTVAGQEVPADSGPDGCALCHEVEMLSWQSSSHAHALEALDEARLTACATGDTSADCSCLNCHTTDFDPITKLYDHGGVTCEACHGDYVEGHPATGVMQLDVDSSVCSSCHQDTHEQWLNTSHAEAGVQCIGCHKAHSQDLRLSTEALCSSCHREELYDTGHLGHIRSNVACVDCHNWPSTEMAGAGATREGARSPNHTFAVATQVCAGCHGQSFHGDQPDAADPSGTAHLAALSDCPEAVVSQLAAVEEKDRSLAGVSALSLGAGLGTGGMLGIILILVVGYITQGRIKP